MPNRKIKEEIRKLECYIEFLRQCIDDRQDDVLEYQRKITWCSNQWCEECLERKANIRRAFEDMEADIVELHEKKKIVEDLNKLMEV